MSDPLLPAPDADRGEDAAEEFSDAEHDAADVEEDVLPGDGTDPDEDEDEDEADGGAARPAAYRRPDTGERLTAGELEDDLDEG